MATVYYFFSGAASQRNLESVKNSRLPMECLPVNNEKLDEDTLVKAQQNTREEINLCYLGKYQNYCIFKSLSSNWYINITFSIREQNPYR